MAEFEVLAEHFSRYNSKFRPLYDSLVSEETRCITELQNRKRVYHYDSKSEVELEKHCRKLRKGFDRFLEREKSTYKQKGMEFCLKTLESEGEGDLKEKTEKCLRFYRDGLLGLEDRVTEKLRNILYRYSFENL